MSDVWVANASPVIVLAKAGYLGLLKQLPSKLFLPDAVVAEVLDDRTIRLALGRIGETW